MDGTRIHQAKWDNADIDRHACYALTFKDISCYVNDNHAIIYKSKDRK